ncbi:MAG: NAD-dependent epimerase/dehydratase family protein [Thermodesulfobacteriota bacterium]|nr:NAD-dependent epimerase/dehydratase family protein [Thermodesulfobacteriota bacterium]
MNEQLINQILPYYSKKRILVTGSSGYLATNLIHSLKEVNCTIIRLSRNCNLLPVVGKANVLDITGDICIRETFEKALENVDIVYHFAAQTSVYVANNNPLVDLNINVLPMLNLLEVCRDRGWQPMIIFSGTVTEAGIPNTLPVNEAHEDCPITIYDLHKLFAENYLKCYSRQGIICGTILRLANVYGPGPKSSSTDRGIINMMMHKALAGEQLTIYGKGNCLRDYVYIEDIISAFLQAPIHANRVNGRHFVIGSGEGYTIAQAIKLIADRAALKTGQHIPVKHTEPPPLQSPIEERNFVADTRQFKLATGWQANHSLLQGIDLTLEALLK